MNHNIPVAKHDDYSMSFIFDDINRAFITLPPVVDLSIFIILQRTNELVAKEKITQILIDCCSVKELRDSGIAVLMNLNKFAMEHGIQILMLDTSTAVYARLAPWLPQVTWKWSAEYRDVSKSAKIYNLLTP